MRGLLPYIVWYVFFAIILILILSSCSSLPGSQTIVVEEQIDIPLVEYTTEFQSRAAQELRDLPPGCTLDRPDNECSAIRTLVDNYGRLRSDIRAIQNDNE